MQVEGIDTVGVQPDQGLPARLTFHCYSSHPRALVLAFGYSSTKPPFRQQTE